MRWEGTLDVAAATRLNGRVRAVLAIVGDIPPAARLGATIGGRVRRLSAGARTLHDE